MLRLFQFLFFKFKAKDQVMFDVLKGGVSICCLLSQTNTKTEPFAEGVFLMDESGVLNKTDTNKTARDKKKLID